MKGRSNARVFIRFKWKAYRPLRSVTGCKGRGLAPRLGARRRPRAVLPREAATRGAPYPMPMRKTLVWLLFENVDGPDTRHRTARASHRPRRRRPRGTRRCHVDLRKVPAPHGPGRSTLDSRAVRLRRPGQGLNPGTRARSSGRCMGASLYSWSASRSKVVRPSAGEARNRTRGLGSVRALLSASAPMCQEPLEIRVRPRQTHRVPVGAQGLPAVSSGSESAVLSAHRRSSRPRS